MQRPLPLQRSFVSALLVQSCEMCGNHRAPFPDPATMSGAEVSDCTAARKEGCGVPHALRSLSSQGGFSQMSRQNLFVFVFTGLDDEGDVTNNPLFCEVERFGKRQNSPCWHPLVADETSLSFISPAFPLNNSLWKYMEKSRPADGKSLMASTHRITRNTLKCLVLHLTNSKDNCVT